MFDIDRIKKWSTNSYRTEVKKRSTFRQMHSYLHFTKLTPEQLIKEQRDKPDERPGQRRILAFYKYLQEEEGRTPIAAFDYTKAIRSFYNYYGVKLSFRNNELETPATKEKDFPLTLSNIQGMVFAANERGKALILTAESTGLRIGDIVRLKRSEVETLLDREAPVELEILCTEKERIPATTFLHQAAIDSLKEYLASRTDNYPWLFPTADGTHLSTKEADRITKTAFKNAGFKNGGLRIRTHCLRKFTIGRLQDSGVEENIWKRIVGKKVPEAAYSSNKLRESYLKAIHKLDPTNIHNNHAKLTDIESKMELLEKENLRLKTEIAQLQSSKAIESFNVFKQEMKTVLKEAFQKSQPASEIVNGQPTELEPVKINGAETLILKALAKAYHKLYTEAEEVKRKEKA